jgi:hypothetical protein
MCESGSAFAAWCVLHVVGRVRLARFPLLVADPEVGRAARGAS